MSSEVHIMKTKHFISLSVTVFRVIGHKNSENTHSHIEKNGFLVKINTVPGVCKIKINTVAKGLTPEFSVHFVQQTPTLKPTLKSPIVYSAHKSQANMKKTWPALYEELISHDVYSMLVLALPKPD
jgi:hypothetical protein